MNILHTSRCVHCIQAGMETTGVGRVHDARHPLISGASVAPRWNGCCRAVVSRLPGCAIVNRRSLCAKKVTCPRGAHARLDVCHGEMS